MGSLSFLIMLSAYALILYWYALNFERDRDGQDGILAIREANLEEKTAKTKSKANPILANRKERLGGQWYVTPLDSIRARVAKMRDRSEK